MRRILINLRTRLLDRLTVRRLLFVIIPIATVLALYTYLHQRSTDVAIQIIGDVATAFSALLIVFELRNSKKEKKVEYLVELNNYFHGNEILMNVYRMLELENYNKEGASNFVDLDVCDFAAYSSFYENIAFMVENGSTSIGDIDSLFGYRFFSMMHCPYIQETLILPTSSSWQKLFELYEKWINYREKLYSDGKRYGMKTIRYENRYTRRYLKEKMYMYDRGYRYQVIGNQQMAGKTIQFRTLAFPDITAMFNLQNLAMPKELSSAEFFPLQRSEAIESMHKDCCIGAFDQEKLVGFCVLIPDDGTKRNLSIATKQNKVKHSQTLTFDFIIVHPEYRRQGLHTAFIHHAISFAKSVNATTILAATSANNEASLQSFLSFGFKVLKKDVKLYNGRSRVLLEYTI